MENLIAIITFFSTFCLILSGWYVREDRRRKRRDAFIQRLHGLESTSANPKNLHTSLSGWIERVAQRLFDLHPLEEMLLQSGSSLKPGTFLTLSIGTALAMVLGMLIVTGMLLVAVIFALCAGIMPTVWLFFRRHRREQDLQVQLPDAISMIARSLRAGQSLDEALQQTAKASPDPLGMEIHRIHEEMSLGLPFETAIHNFQKRFSRLSDVKVLCSAFLIQRETGGNLTQLLEGISFTIRERFRMRRQIQAITAEGRLSAGILGSLPFAFALFMWLLRPDYLQLLYTHPTGKLVLLGAGLFEAIGFSLLYLLTRIDT